MKLRLLDEVLELGERGIALLWMEAGDDVRPYAGMKLRDARGNVHAVASVSEHDELTTLYLPEGNADSFGQLLLGQRVNLSERHQILRKHHFPPPMPQIHHLKTGMRRMIS